MSTPTPNMGLPLSSVGVDSGLNWELNLNSSLTTIDGHNHSPGNGSPISSAGISIQSDFPLNSNNLTLARSVRFTPQAAALSLSTDLGCLYEAGVDLYYNDGNGNQIRITQSGSVTGSSGTITGLPSGTASAAYSSGTFTFQSATNTAANLDGGYLNLRNSTAGSHKMTVNPPTAMGADTAITLPAVPAVQCFMAIDTTGNMSGYTSVSGGITSSMIQNGTIVTGNIAAATITQSNMASGSVGTAQIINGNVTPAKLTACNTAISSSTGTYNNNTSGPTPIGSLTITTSGRPVEIRLQPDGNVSSNQAIMTASGNATGTIYCQRSGRATYNALWTLGSLSLPVGGVNFVDLDVVGTPGTYTYTFYGIYMLVNYSRFLANEL